MKRVVELAKGNFNRCEYANGIIQLKNRGNYLNLNGPSAVVGGRYDCAVSDDGKHILIVGQRTMASPSAKISHDYGTTFIDVPIGVPADMPYSNCCCMSADGKFMGIGYYLPLPWPPVNNLIYSSNDYGSTWSGFSGAGLDYVMGIDCSEDGALWLIAMGATFPLAYGDGFSWTPDPLIATTAARCAIGYMGNCGVVSTWGPNQLNLYSIGSGIFTLTGPAGQWYGVAISTDGKYVLAGNQSTGMFYISNDFGITMNPIALPLVGTPQNCSMSRDGKLMVLCFSGGMVYTSTDFGVTWNPETSLGVDNWVGCRVSCDGSKFILTVDVPDTTKVILWTK